MDGKRVATDDTLYELANRNPEMDDKIEVPVAVPVKQLVRRTKRRWYSEGISQSGRGKEYRSPYRNWATKHKGAK